MSPNRSEHALAFREVTKQYDGRSTPALSDVSFTLEPGRKISIVGRSGSGKSTLLHLAAGIDVPSAGKVSILGQDLDAMNERQRTLLRRNQIGLVFQFFYLLPHLTVHDNIALPELIAGTALSRFEERLHHLLARVGLRDRAGDSVEKLSGGEMQRVAICRALLKRPRILLADEPTGNLDDKNARVVMELMLELAAEEKSSLIFVTHSQELASLAEETWSIHSGILERNQ